MIKQQSWLKYFGYNGYNVDSNGKQTHSPPLPGTSQKCDIPKSTAYGWEKKGYIEDKGYWCLTAKGYNALE